MAAGQVKAWLEDRGFGFITEDGGDDVFVHARSLPRGVRVLEPGSRVRFSKRKTERGMQATDVELLSDCVPDVLTAEDFIGELNRRMSWLPSAARPELLEMARAHGWVD